MIRKLIEDSIEVKINLLKDKRLIKTIEDIGFIINNTLKNQGQILLCGNGGSAADAQHIAAEFTGRFKKDRKPLNAEALHCNTSYITAVANDYSYNEIYSRLVEAKAKSGDVLIAFSTSGNSINIINALVKAKEIGVITVGFTGAKDCEMDAKCNYLIKIPSTDTARIQECHILIGHIICEIVEEKLF